MCDFLGKSISTRENSWDKGTKVAKCLVCLNNSRGGGVAGAGGKGSDRGVMGSRDGESDHAAGWAIGFLLNADRQWQTVQAVFTPMFLSFDLLALRGMN